MECLSQILHNFGFLGSRLAMFRQPNCFLFRGYFTIFLQTNFHSFFKFLLNVSYVLFPLKLDYGNIHDGFEYFCSIQNFLKNAIISLDIMVSYDNNFEKNHAIKSLQTYFNMFCRVCNNSVGMLKKTGRNMSQKCCNQSS